MYFIPCKHSEFVNSRCALYVDDFNVKTSICKLLIFALSRNTRKTAALEMLTIFPYTVIKTSMHPDGPSVVMKSSISNFSVRMLFIVGISSKAFSEQLTMSVMCDTSSFVAMDPRRCSLDRNSSTFASSTELFGTSFLIDSLVRVSSTTLWVCVGM